MLEMTQFKTYHAVPIPRLKREKKNNPTIRDHIAYRIIALPYSSFVAGSGRAFVFPTLIVLTEGGSGCRENGA